MQLTGLRVMWTHRKISPDVNFIPNCYSSLNNLTTTAEKEDQGILHISVCAFNALNRKRRKKIRSQPHWIFAQVTSLHKRWHQNPQFEPRPLSHISPKKYARFFRILDMFSEKKLNCSYPEMLLRELHFRFKNDKWWWNFESCAL